MDGDMVNHGPRGRSKSVGKKDQEGTHMARVQAGGMPGVGATCTEKCSGKKTKRHGLSKEKRPPDRPEKGGGDPWSSAT